MIEKASLLTSPHSTFCVFVTVVGAGVLAQLFNTKQTSAYTSLQQCLMSFHHLHTTSSSHKLETNHKQTSNTMKMPNPNTSRLSLSFLTLWLVIGCIIMVTRGAEETTFFGVYSDDQCTVPLNPAVPTSRRIVVGEGECYTFSYNAPPDNRVQTNSEEMFNCCAGKFSFHMMLSYFY